MPDQPLEIVMRGQHLTPKCVCGPMRTAPRSYSLSVDLRVSNVPRQDLPISDCWGACRRCERACGPNDGDKHDVVFHAFLPVVVTRIL
jgi:hypothetical protein